MKSDSGASPESSGVLLEGVRRVFGDVIAVDDVSFRVRQGEFFSLLGPSGCGKTTLLRLIAGFEQPDAGRIVIGGSDVTVLRPQLRPTAMVFQNYALFPTMTVGENVGYGLRIRRVGRADREKHVDELLRRVELPGLQRRPVTQLSGGQQQRVALARALAVEPDVLLFDEPLSNLDVALRDQTRRELKRLQQRLGTTSIYVTHDQQEALALSDRVAVMRQGRFVQVDTPRILFNQPATAFVAQFLGWNVVVDSDAAGELGIENQEAGSAAAIRPEDLVVGTTGLEARVDSVQFLGLHQELMVTTPFGSLRAWTAPDLEPASTVRITARRHRLVQNDLHRDER